MAIFRFDPVRSFEGLTKRMNEFVSDIDKGINIEFGSYAPRVDIIEDEKNIYIQAELAGVPKEEVKVSVNDDNVLSIKGNKKRSFNENEKLEDKTYIRSERNFGEFSRAFLLPDNVKKDSIQAKFENGVLFLNLEKIEPEKPKEIHVDIK